MSRSILYYPSIDIQDGTWLRSAALYWDEVCSIVPYTGYPDLSPEILYLQQRGQYRAVFPQDVFVLGDPHAFSEMVSRRFSLRSIRSKGKKNRRGRSPYFKTRAFYSPDLTAMIHCDKMPAQILDALLKCGLANPGEDGWVETSDDVAMLYMRLLAEFLIKHDENDMVLGSDRLRGIQEVYPLNYGKAADRAAVSLVLENCLPIPACDVGFEDLLDFKQRRRAELLALQEKILELERNIACCESVELVKNHIATFRAKWEKELVNAEKMFRGDGIPFAAGSLRSFIADAGAAAGLLQWAQGKGLRNMPPLAFGAAVGGAGLIGFGARCLHYKKRIRETNMENGFAYIISAAKAGLLRSRNIDEVEWINR